MIVGRLGRSASQSSPRLAVAGLAVLGLWVGVVVALFAYRQAYHGRIYPGVRVDGVSIGGETREQAKANLGNHLQASIQVPLFVEVGNRRWQLSRQALGAHYDLDSLVNAAYAVGRNGSVISDLFTPAAVLVFPTDLAASVQLGSTDWHSVLDPIANSVNRPVVSATLTVTSDHQVALSPDQTGVNVDIPLAEQAIAKSLLTGSILPVQMPIHQTPPAVRAAALQSARSEAQAILRAPVTVSYEGHTWSLSVDDLQRALILPNSNGSSGPKKVRLDAAVLHQFVAQIASQVDQPSRDAQLVVNKGVVTVLPEQTGHTVDVAKTEEKLQALLFTSQRSMSPVVSDTTPSIKASDWNADFATAQAIVHDSLVLQGPSGASWTLSPSGLLNMLVLPAHPSSQNANGPGLDSGKLKTFVQEIAQKVDRPAQNARFQLVNGHVSVLRDSKAGRTVDQAKAMDVIQSAARSGNRTVSLPVSSAAPVVTADAASEIAGLQLIAENSTSYVGSIPPRRHNVELATSMLNGVVLPPGAIFSFNSELGPTTLARGYQVGFGIVAQGDTVKTVPSIGGGICQVATTLFQPVFWTGYEIEERYAHAYYIAHYRSHGYPGLDTTVDEGAGLDFRFKNDTSGDLLIQSRTDGSNVYFSLYGVQPTWKVNVDKPVISNLVKTDPKLQIQYDPTMLKGQEIYTEAAEDGFDVLIRRTVTDSNGHSRVLDLRSTYEPSHNVMLVGTKGA